MDLSAEKNETSQNILTFKLVSAYFIALLFFKANMSVAMELRFSTKLSTKNNKYRRKYTFRAIPRYTPYYSKNNIMTLSTNNIGFLHHLQKIPTNLNNKKTLLYHCGSKKLTARKKINIPTHTIYLIADPKN